MTSTDVQNAIHLVHPTNGSTLCAEPIGDGWIERSPSEPKVTCGQCLTQQYWLPAAGLLERGAILTRVEEPWPTGVRKHVVGDDDPARGRLARPEHLQVCLTCAELRGPYDSYGIYDNLCKCDYTAWHRTPTPRFGDLSRNVHLCLSCAAKLVSSGTRWSPYYCAECRPAIALFRRLTGRNIVPYGPHSIMNGVSWRPTDGNAMSDAQAVAFHDQLQALFTEQRNLHKLHRERVLTLATQLGFDAHAVLANRWVEACHHAAWTSEVGFLDLLTQLGTGEAGELGGEIWQIAHEARK